MRTRLLGIVAAAAAILGGACVHKSEEPGLTGPSTFATSLNVSASPDVLNLGQGALTTGQASTITIQVNEWNGQVPAGTTVRLQTTVNGSPQDCGVLSQRTLTVPSSGRVTTTFTAPGYPLPLPQCLNFTAGNTVAIEATLEGSNFQTASVPIRMIQTGVILPPLGTPTPAFDFFPSSPVIGGSVQFDARFSCPGATQNGACANDGGTIVSYAWNFGDGGTAVGPIVYHAFAVDQTYTVTLTVTNSAGLSAGVTKQVTVITGFPIPDFTITPAAGGPGTTVTVNASTTKTFGGTTIVTYQWTFEGGSPVTATGQVATSTFNAARVTPYTISLTVTDSIGRVATASKTITIQ